MLSAFSHSTTVLCHPTTLWPESPAMRCRSKSINFLSDLTIHLHTKVAWALDTIHIYITHLSKVFILMSLLHHPSSGHTRYPNDIAHPPTSARCVVAMFCVCLSSYRALPPLFIVRAVLRKVGCALHLLILGLNKHEVSSAFRSRATTNTAGEARLHKSSNPTKTIAHLSTVSVKFSST